MIALRGKNAIAILFLCYGYGILLFEESTFTQCVNDSNGESMCKPWKGLLCVVLYVFMHYQILYVCIPFGLYFPYSMGGFIEA